MRLWAMWITAYLSKTFKRTNSVVTEATQKDLREVGGDDGNTFKALKYNEHLTLSA